MRRIALLVAVLLAGMFAVPVYAEAATVIDRQRIVGATAFADFAYEDGATMTFVSVIVNDSTTLTPPQPGGPEVMRFANISIFRYDMTTGEVYVAAFGMTEQFDLTITRDLSSAHLVTRFDVAEMIRGEMVTVAVDITWHASAELVDDVVHTRYRERGFLLQSTSVGEFRDSLATGTLELREENFTPVPSTAAQLQDVKSGSLTLIISTP